MTDKKRHDWIHYVGRSYYSIKAFVAEAGKIEVSRRVSWKLLKRFQWGDKIWLAQGDLRTKTRKSPAKGSIVFGFFTLETILFEGGLVSRLKETIPLVETWSGDTPIHRGCGKYKVVEKYSTSATVEGISQAVRELNGHTNPTILLGGPFQVVTPQILLPDMYMRWGFCRVDPGFWDRSRVTPDDPVLGDWKIPIDSLDGCPRPGDFGREVIHIETYQLRV